MQLYQTTSFDAPFGPSDLEWLYRYQDVDGLSLQSRLASLAPISFLNPIDGLRRRRMFSTDSWETTNFVWASDSPASWYNGPNLATTNGSFFPANYNFNLSTFYNPDQLYDNASLRTRFNIAYYNAAVNPSQPNTTTIPAVNYATPSLAHRDRKINLNYPLPVSNDPNEPVRQKWILESYQLMKLVLPPSATDSAQELAQLSQFLTNVIDFRDPDATMTRFVNPDVRLSASPQANANTTTGYSTCTAAIPYRVGIDTPAYTGAVDIPLEQFGMEYNPVSLNECPGLLLREQGDGQRVGAGVHPPLLRRAVQHARARPPTPPRSCRWCRRASR